MKQLIFDEIASPIGTILMVCDGDALCALDYEDYRGRMLDLLRARYGEVKLARAGDPNGYGSWLQSYFRGKLDALDGIRVDGGGTAFQRRVWQALRGIPAGATASYGEIAARIGAPSAARAVGLANSLNPVAIAVPCHRVVGAGGKLAGYAGGLDRKRWLLAHESQAQFSATGRPSRGLKPTPAR